MSNNSVLYLFFAGVHLIFVVLLIQQLFRNFQRFTLISVLVIIGLFYDNAVIGLGNLIGEGGVLINLNVGRYIYHVIFTPTLALFAYEVINKSRYSRVQKKIFFCVILAITISLMIIGASIDLVGMEMIMVFENDVTRYVNITASGRLPIPAIIVNVLLIASGLLIWREYKSPWLAIGSIIMFIMYGTSPGNLLLSNIGEVAFCGGILGINYDLLKKKESQAS